MKDCFRKRRFFYEPGPPGPPGPLGPPGSSSAHGYIYNLDVQTLLPEAEIPFDQNGIQSSGISHAAGAAEIVIAESGDYYISFSVTGSAANQFALFLDGNLVNGTIYGSDDENQQNFGQAILTLPAGATLTVRYYNNVVPIPVTLQTLAGGTQENTNAAVFIQKLGMQTAVSVTTSAELLAALNDNTISTINLEAGAYDISASLIIRTTAVRLQSAVATANVVMNGDQEFSFITIGDNVAVSANRIRNVTTGMDYATIQDAINAATAGDVIQLSPGVYQVTVALGPPLQQLLINKSITLRGISARLTQIEFVSGGSLDLAYMSIQADNVIIENIRFTGPTPVGLTQNSLFNIALKSFPSDLYVNSILRYNIFEGGRRTAFIDVENVMFVGNEVIHIGAGSADALVFERIRGTTMIYGNVFTGIATSRRTFSIEGSFAEGTIQISNNKAINWTQFILFNIITTNISFLVTENYVVHSASGSTVIFDMEPGGLDFAQFNLILIEGNIFIQPFPNRLAVYVDYRPGGTSVPTDGQIQIYSNYFSYALPWGRTTAPVDVVDPSYPVGFNSNAPVGTTLAMFDLQNNMNF
ncbi:hypothetical protein [Bacillus sp. Cs-700]|uniref:BclA C-terminal domain-containing protein n=1 Tax=Bacillus sp. Cs-700 TaxID=2589818 RepID=UPI001409287A|nr:hypothetical protein [Bacillus sp. Cs-700]